LEKYWNTLLVDGNSLLKNSFEPTYDSEDNNHINGVYTFLTRIRNQLNTGNHNLLKIVFDGDSRGVLRRLVYPDYKKSRLFKNKKTTKNQKARHDSFFIQKNKLQDYLNHFSYWYQDDKVEADDIISQYVLTKLSNEKITIMTGDVDILQLIDNKVQVLYLNKTFKNKTPAVIRYEKTPNRKNLIITHKNFKKYFGYPHENIALIKTICGDESDDIKNIKGVKEKSLFNCFPFVKEKHTTLDDILKECENKLLEDNIPKKHQTVYKRIFSRETDGVQGKRILEINKRIVDLKNQEFISPRCSLILNKNGFLDREKYTPIKPLEMVKKMNSDGIYEQITGNFKNLKYFFKPIKKTLK